MVYDTFIDEQDLTMTCSNLCDKLWDYDDQFIKFSKFLCKISKLQDGGVDLFCLIINRMPKKFEYLLASVLKPNSIEVNIYVDQQHNEDLCRKFYNLIVMYIEYRKFDSPEFRNELERLVMKIDFTYINYKKGFFKYLLEKLIDGDEQQSTLIRNVYRHIFGYDMENETDFNSFDDKFLDNDALDTCMPIFNGMNETKLPIKKQAMLAYILADSAKIIQTIIKEITFNDVKKSLPAAPAYLLFMVLRYVDESGRKWFVKSMNSIKYHLKSVVKIDQNNIFKQSFWLGNILKFWWLLCRHNKSEDTDPFRVVNYDVTNLPADHNDVRSESYSWYGTSRPESEIVRLDCTKIFKDLSIEVYNKLTNLFIKKLKKDIPVVTAMLEEDTCTLKKENTSAENSINICHFKLNENSENYLNSDDINQDKELDGKDYKNHTALEKLLLQLSKWHFMFNKHGIDGTIIEQFFNQFFYFIAATTLNALLGNKNLYKTASTSKKSRLAKQLEYNLNQIDQWILDEDFPESSVSIFSERLEPLNQVVNILNVTTGGPANLNKIFNKNNSKCNFLTSAQILKILSMSKASSKFTKLVSERLAKDRKDIPFLYDLDPTHYKTTEKVQESTSTCTSKIKDDTLLLNVNFKFEVKIDYASFKSEPITKHRFTAEKLLLSDVSIDLNSLGLNGIAKYNENHIPWSVNAARQRQIERYKQRERGRLESESGSIESDISENTV